MESGEVRDEGFADIMSQLSKNDERKLLQIKIIGSDAVEDKREEFGPGILGQEKGGEFRNGVAEFFRDGFDLFGLEGGEDEGFESGASGVGESGPDIGELAAEEDGGHGSGLGARRGLEEIRQLKC